jgi:hypothetical protein
MAVQTIPYRDLGGFPITSVVDPTGRNPYGPNTYATMVIDADTTFKTNITLTEVYHVWVSAAVGSSFQIWRNTLQWDNVLVGANAWDPSQPLPIRSGDVIYFYFNQPFSTATNANNPTAVVYIREPLAYYS